MNPKNIARVYKMPFSSIYPQYTMKAEKKGRTKAEVDEIIRWLTGYSQKQFEDELEKNTTLEEFYANAPNPSPNRKQITGMICGVRVEDIKEPITQEMRYLDKLIDELAKGRPMDKILRAD